MARGGSTVRKDLRDLAKPMEVRELNRQLEWVWKQLLGGLTDKAFSTDGMTKVVKRVEKVVARELDVETIDTNELKAALVRVMVGEIGVANIDFAQIKDLSAGLAIFEKTLSGKLYSALLEVTDANIVGMSANKITAGTIDAAEIEVVNLKAANITVGTINGQQIAPGAIDTSHLANGSVTNSKIDFGAIAANKLNLTTHMIF